MQAGVREAALEPNQENNDMNLSFELDREDDGRWIAEALELPGVMAYGDTREEAISNTERLAIEVIADRIKHGEMLPSAFNVSFQV
jgi:predicted RNase H-like HicB family nuclease